jgi:DivIVA domain-containing protein
MNTVSFFAQVHHWSDNLGEDLLGVAVILLVAGATLAFFKYVHVWGANYQKEIAEKDKMRRSKLDIPGDLSPEDIVNKRFSQTKFGAGYSQDEVDDFLDKTVLEFRSLQEENTQLKRRLANSEIVIGSFTPVIVTVEKVAQKRFTSVRVAGYDTLEVDYFLDEIIFELRRLNTENQELADQIVANGAETV